MGKRIAFISLYLQFTVLPLLPVHQRVRPSHTKADVFPRISVYNGCSCSSPHPDVMRSEIDGFARADFSRGEHLPIAVFCVELLQVESGVRGSIPQNHDSGPVVHL